MPLETSIKLVYIGPKPVKKDNVTYSAFVWAGWGDVQEVPIEIGRKLLAFPTVWVTEQKFAEMQAIAKAAGSEKAAELPNTAKDKEPQGESGSSDQQDEAPPQVPAAGGDRAATIKAAIQKLQPGNPEHFAARTGAPLTDAVKTIMGDDSLSFKEVAAVWAELKAEASK